MVRISFATIVSLFTLFALILIAMGLFGQPDIVIIRQTGQSECPQNIGQNFNLKFVNYGSDEGEVHAELTSDVVQFRKPIDNIVVPPGKETILTFDIIQQSLDAEPLWLTIDYKWEYKKYYFLKQKEQGKCEYKNDPQRPRYYVLK